MICDIFQHSPVFRTGGDEFVVILTGRDYLIRKELVLALHDRSVEHISTRRSSFQAACRNTSREWTPASMTCLSGRTS